MISHDDVQAAARRLAGVAHRTPVITGRALDEATGAGRVLLKAENLQRAGAFKFRGAYNAVASLDPAERARGVCTVSSGNHAQALALAARLHAVPAVILMPADAPQGKRAATKGYGAEIVPFDRYDEDREELLAALVAERGLVPIHPYDDERVMAGQGTVALELLEDAGPLDLLLVCVGGGGLVAGCATAVHGLSPDTRVIGVEPEAGDDTRRSLQAGERVAVPVPRTIADGQQLPIPGEITFPVVQRLVADVVTVSDEEIVAAMRLLFERAKTVAEPSGACAFAALLAGRVDAAGLRVGVTISGGNVTAERFAELVSRVTFALWQPGWHWPLVAAAVFIVSATLAVVGAGQSESEWLGARKRSFKRLAWLSAALVIIAVSAGQLHKLKGMLLRVQDGDPKWLGFAVGVEAISFIGYIALSWEMFRRHAPRLTLASATEMTFGGVVATRLFSAGGAGGIAFMTWTLRAAGMEARTIAKQMSVFLAIMYTPYTAACILGGLGGGAPAAVTWTGVGLGVVAFGAAALITLIPGDVERRARKLASGHGRVAKLAAKLASVPAIAGEATRAAVSLARQRPSLVGWAILYWAADVAVLDACFRAFDAPVALGVLILGYFLGHIGNLLPMPGGIGGVEGGMVGVFVACGVPLSEAIVGTIAYQVISTWLPVVPGLGAYFSLRRRVNRWREEDGLEPEDRGASTVPGGRRPATAER